VRRETVDNKDVGEGKMGRKKKMKEGEKIRGRAAMKYGKKTWQQTVVGTEYWHGLSGCISVV
jgi:hypothetical protein